MHDKLIKASEGLALTVAAVVGCALDGLTIVGTVWAMAIIAGCMGWFALVQYANGGMDV